MEISATEKIILNASRKILYEKGYSGTRMQEIADVAGLNKSLIHYYYRSKEKLFKLIFKDSIQIISEHISKILERSNGLFELIDRFIYESLLLFQEKKNLLSFIINEYNQNYDRVKNELNPLIDFFNRFERKIVELSNKDGIIVSDSKQLIISIVSLCGGQIIGMSNKLLLDQSLKSENSSTDIVQEKNKIYDFIIKSLQN